MASCASTFTDSSAKSRWPRNMRIQIDMPATHDAKDATKAQSPCSAVSAGVHTTNELWQGSERYA